MEIYFACSISGGRKDEKAYQYLVQVMTGMGIAVPTAHIAETGVEEIDALEEPLDIYQRDVNWIQESDMLVAEVSTPSHGVGYEVGYALDLDKPVLCLYKEGVIVSKMITGNPHPLLSVMVYEDLIHAEEILHTYLTNYEKDLDQNNPAGTYTKGFSSNGYLKRQKPRDEEE